MKPIERLLKIYKKCSIKYNYSENCKTHVITVKYPQSTYIHTQLFFFYFISNFKFNLFISSVISDYLKWNSLDIDDYLPGDCMRKKMLVDFLISTNSLIFVQTQISCWFWEFCYDSSQMNWKFDFDMGFNVHIW